MKRGLIRVLAGAAASVLLAGCVSDGGGPPESANSSRGPIEIWLSTNPEEVAWGEEMVASWNSQHPDEKITAQQIPAGKTSEEVIYSSIVAGNAPCVVMNTAPSAVPQFQKAGGLVPVDTFPDGDSYINERTGNQVADQYRSPDGRFYQIPWKVNPVMIFYNKELFAEAGLDPENPPLKTWAEFLETSRTLVEKGVAHAAIWPAPSSEFFQSWFDYYPLSAARTQQQLVEDGKATFDSPDGVAVGQFWRTMYEEKLAPRRSTTVTRSRTARPRWRSSGHGRSPSTRTPSTGVSFPFRPRTGSRRTRSTRSATRSRWPSTSRASTGSLPGTS